MTISRSAAARRPAYWQAKLGTAQPSSGVHRIELNPGDELTASELIERYPRLTEGELERLIELYCNLPALSVALIISDDVLGPKLDQFVNDHRKRIKTPFGQYAVLVVIALIGIAIAAWAGVVGVGAY